MKFAYSGWSDHELANYSRPLEEKEMKVIEAPNKYVDSDLFLAGSIEMGVAELWQDKVINALKDSKLVILNPRRSDWDNSWVQEASNPQFHEQVTWEMRGLRNSRMVCFYFDPNTKSPVTLMELGMSMQHRWHQKHVVCCPKGFWRRGNVEILCQTFKIKFVETLDEMIQWIKDNK